MKNQFGGGVELNDQLLDPDAPTLASQGKLKVSPKGLPFVMKEKRREEREEKRREEKRRGRKATEMSCTPVNLSIVKLLCGCHSCKAFNVYNNKLHSSKLT